MKVCPFCAEEIQDAAIVCKHCHKDLPPPVDAAARQAADDADDKYLGIFRLFDQNEGSFRPTMNWAALFFGAIWYLYRGMWAKAGIMILLILFTAGVALPVAWIYSALAGNYDYYLLRRRHTQFWS